MLASSADWASLGSRAFGEVVTDRRTSFVRRLRNDSGDYHVKCYEYATWRSRIGGFWRFTGPFSRSRAAREFDALTWLGQNAPPAAQAVAVFESRRLGLVHQAILITATFAGEPLSTRLARCHDTEKRTAIADALGRYIGRLHRLGFRCRNLDLRNLIADTDEQGEVQIALIDSPRYRLRRPGQAPDALSEADWRRLLPQLAPFGLGARTRAAAAAIRSDG